MGTQIMLTVTDWSAIYVTLALMLLPDLFMHIHLKIGNKAKFAKNI